MNYFLEHIRLDDTVNCPLAEDSHSVISMVQMKNNFGHKIVNISYPSIKTFVLESH